MIGSRLGKAGTMRFGMSSSPNHHMVGGYVELVCNHCPSLDRHMLYVWTYKVIFPTIYACQCHNIELFSVGYTYNSCKGLESRYDS